MNEIGRTAVDLLFHYINLPITEDPSPETRILKTELIIRASSQKKRVN
jgi:DNA-binding LacI/PurR family transcriptional regulator